MKQCCFCYNRIRMLKRIGAMQMNALLEAAKELSGFMSGHKWRHCVIGGLAVQRWGEARTTLDVDFTVLCGWGGEETYVRRLLENFAARYENAHDFALSHRVLLLRASNGIDLDVALGALPFEEEMLGRVKMEEFAPGVVLPCCSPEDLFIMKAFAARPRDWLDAESVARRQLKLDAAYILGHLAELSALKEDPEILLKAKRILEENK